MERESVTPTANSWVTVRRWDLAWKAFGVCFIVTGVAKLLSMWSDAPVLKHGDVVTGLQNGTLMLLVGTTEVLAGFLLALGFLRNLQAPLTVWFFCASFVTYRIILWTSDSPGLCPCLGHLIEYSAFLQRYGDSILTGIAVSGLLLAGCQILSWTDATPKKISS